MKNNKIQVMVDDSTLVRIDKAAKSMNISRSSYCLMMITKSLPLSENVHDSSNLDILQLKIE